ncbi:hypothetical protein GCM10023321_37080 [Pseudonocardia eucalypti]|uniref:Uncharacterized protein n=1 Tax=Pseudonocardia eucalypti TaxID=648755 RepID=A0ABP9Q7M5_9PSEU
MAHWKPSAQSRHSNAGVAAASASSSAYGGTATTPSTHPSRSIPAPTRRQPPRTSRFPRSVWAAHPFWRRHPDY